jgi:hypothetical protein
VRIIAACTLALLATSVGAENLVVDNPLIKYEYTFGTVKSLHFCDLSTFITKPPLRIKLTAALVTDDAQPKDKDFRVSYNVEAFAMRAAENAPLETMPIKVDTARIISDVFDTDLHSTKNVDNSLGASYIITSEGSLALFTNLMTRGAYTLYVEFQNNSSLTVDVKPTGEIVDASTKWTKCSVAIMQRQKPPE